MVIIIIIIIIISLLSRSSRPLILNKNVITELFNRYNRLRFSCIMGRLHPELSERLFLIEDAMIFVLANYFLSTYNDKSKKPTVIRNVLTTNTTRVERIDQLFCPASFGVDASERSKITIHLKIDYRFDFHSAWRLALPGTSAIRVDRLIFLQYRIVKVLLSNPPHFELHRRS
ncbi:unnamed protein product [Amoebophrya sp. A25]|nr:unnamed protein product [Amoebophrya sp. A25]|eukprot:GSA25T00001018001.1